MDNFHLKRFRDAQEYSYDDALREIRAGRKKSHWMWYIFPQIEGLGHSNFARIFAIHSLEEARAYLRDPVLGGRLVEISEALLALGMTDAEAIFGWPDVLKLKSSMTLFAMAEPNCPTFRQVLERFYGGHEDIRTRELLGL